MVDFPQKDINATLFAGLFSMLALAGLVGLLLKLRIGFKRPHSGIDNLNARIRAWWWMVGLLALAFWAGEAWVTALFCFVSFQCLREFLSVTYTRRGDYRALLAAFFLVLPLQYILIASHWYGLFSIFIPVYAFLLLPIISTLGGDATRFLERTAKVQWGLMICVYCLSHMPALLSLQIPGFAGRNLQLITFLVLVVQSSDVFQYVAGKLFGRHKLSPEISPSKTVEGLCGGILVSTLIGAALWWITPFTLLQAAAIAFTVNVLGFFGGFVLSAIKRDRGLKDWGTLIEGHGGMLDRVDSLSFSAPIFFHIVRYWWVP